MDLRREGSALIDFFCEDKDTFKLDECFRIFQDFCIKFKKAVKVRKDAHFFVVLFDHIVLSSYTVFLLLNHFTPFRFSGQH